MADNLDEFPATIELQLNDDDERIHQTVTNYVGWILQRYNMVHWRLSNIDPETIVIGFRPFNTEIDSTVLGTLHH